LKNIPIGEVLKEYGYITEAQLQQALAKQEESQVKKRLGEVLVDLGYVTEYQVLTALGERLKIPLYDLSKEPIDTDAVCKIPKQLAAKYCLIAISAAQGHLMVAVNDPLNFYAIEDIRQVTNMPLSLVLSEKNRIINAIDYYYSEICARQVTEDINDAAEELGTLQEEAVEHDDDAAPVVRLVNSLLLRGHSTNASDIHVEPFEFQTTVRMRIDGMMVKYVTLAASLHVSIIARIKIMANLDITEKRAPQDGHFRIRLEGVEINMRVSVIPTVYGEKAVLRFLSSDALIDRSGHFGMDTDNYEKLCKMLRSPHGIIYLTGPTGSGKTTTLYMALERLVEQPVNIATIEDPVERNITGISQVQVNPLAGVTFESGLRALLRQDPDVIMVGETRDAETATISVRAAITGHLVLSTLHTNDAVSTVVRLEDMGLPAYLVANSLVGVVAQRLVRKICSNCGETYEPSLDEQQAAGLMIKQSRRGAGCHICNNTGYKGRIAIHEVLMMDKTVRRMVTEGRSSEELYAYAKEHQHMISLKDSVQKLVEAGVTTLEEMIRTTYYAD
jgi:type IV pilus assembly protein PilB